MDYDEMDVKSAFLYGEIEEEVYVTQPKGFEDPYFPKHVYKVVKALYGLHQAPRAWDILLVQVYVDDIIFGSTNKAWCEEFEVLMQGEFEMSAMGEMSFFLGLQVKQLPDGIFISQDKYVKDMLTKFDMESVRSATTPYEAAKTKLKDESDPLVNCLFKTSSYSTDFSSECSQEDFQVSKRATKSRLVCKKQTIVATSSTEAEYVAAASCCAQVLWIQNQLLDYGFNFMNTKIFIDNQSTICIVKNPVFHQRTKHIEIRHHFIRDANEKNLIQVLKIHTDDNVADLLTKGIERPRFEYLVVHIGMMDMVFCGIAGSYYDSAGVHLLLDALFLLVSYGLSDGSVFAGGAYFCGGFILCYAALSSIYAAEWFVLLILLAGWSLPLVTSFLLVVSNPAGVTMYALTHAPPFVFDSLVKQFWATVVVRPNAAGSHDLVATIDGREVVVTESLIRTRYTLTMPMAFFWTCANNDILEGMRVIGYPTDRTLTFLKIHLSPQWRFLVHTLMHCLSPKSGSWNQFPSSIATALICLSTGRVYNFSRFILEGMIGNLKAKQHKFLMYPRFLQMIVALETADRTPRQTFAFTRKMFANMKFKWEGQPIPLTPPMLAIAAAGDDADGGDDAANEDNAAANEAAGSAAEAHLVPPSPPVSPVREPTPERQPVSERPPSPSPTIPETEWVVPHPVSPVTDWRPWPFLVFGPEPRLVGYVDPDVIEPIIFGPQPRPHGYVDPDFVEPIIFGPQPRPDNYLELEDLGNIISMEDDTTHDGFHVESPVRSDDSPTPTADAAGRAEDPALLTDLSAKLDRVKKLEKTELRQLRTIRIGGVMSLCSGRGWWTIRMMLALMDYPRYDICSSRFNLLYVPSEVVEESRRWKEELDELMMRMTETDWLNLMMQVGSNPAWHCELLGVDVTGKLIERLHLLSPKPDSVLLLHHNMLDDPDSAGIELYCPSTIAALDSAVHASASESDGCMELYIPPLHMVDLKLVRLRLLPHVYREDSFFCCRIGLNSRFILNEVETFEYSVDWIVSSGSCSPCTSYCRDVFVAGNVIQTIHAGLRQAYECIASAPIPEQNGTVKDGVQIPLYGCDGLPKMLGYSYSPLIHVSRNWTGVVVTPGYWKLMFFDCCFILDAAVLDAAATVSAACIITLYLLVFVMLLVRLFLLSSSIFADYFVSAATQSSCFEKIYLETWN
ncbi:putative ribonuclease H-like domain-containing protein [Tanacetum coccineum]